MTRKKECNYDICLTHDKSAYYHRSNVPPQTAVCLSAMAAVAITIMDRDLVRLHIADPDKSTNLPTTCRDCKHCINILQHLLSSSSSPGRQSVRDSAETWYVDICQRLGVAHVQVQNITGITNGTKSCIVQFALPQEPHRHCSHEDRSGVSRPVAPPKKNSPTKKSSHQFWTKQSNDWT